MIHPSGHINRQALPGGELSTTSQVIDHTEKIGPDEPPPDLPEGLNISLEQQELVRSFIQAQQATIRLWEYRYLRDYLVFSTHRVLAWLNLQNSTSIDLFNAFWSPVIPIAKSREKILSWRFRITTSSLYATR